MSHPLPQAVVLVSEGDVDGTRDEGAQLGQGEREPAGVDVVAALVTCAGMECTRVSYFSRGFQWRSFVGVLMREVGGDVR